MYLDNLHTDAIANSGGVKIIQGSVSISANGSQSVSLESSPKLIILEIYSAPSSAYTYGMALNIGTSTIPILGPTTTSAQNYLFARVVFSSSSVTISNPVSNSVTIYYAILI